MVKKSIKPVGMSASEYRKRYSPVPKASSSFWKKKKTTYR
jgi:hypothetical protein